MKRRTIVLLAAGLLAAGLCAGCGRKFTRQRYETIYMGMPQAQVRRILGRATSESAGRWSYVRARPYRKAGIRFENACVKDKSWSWQRPGHKPEP